MSVPFIFSRIVLGAWLPTILTQLEVDSIYYMIQIQKVLHGNWMIGNPYLLEYSTAAYPAPLLSVWLAAIPGLLGADINAVYAVNALLYATLTGGILYALCLRLTNRHQLLSLIIAVLGTASMSNFILRPVFMQTVYPVFGLFMIALLGVLEKPYDAKRSIALGIVSALGFYIYPHLWMQNFTSLGLLFLAALWQRDTKMLKQMTIMGIGMIIVCLPQILTTIALFTDPAAKLINQRVGMLSTHAVLPVTIMNNKYSITTIVVLLLLRAYDNKRRFSKGELLLLLLASAVVIAALSNTVTGLVMDFITHPWRLGLMVNVVTIPVMITSFRQRQALLPRVLIGMCLAALVFTTVNRVFIRQNSYGYLCHRDEIVEQHTLTQDYERIFAYFSGNDIPPSVILAPERLSQIIPLYSEHGVLYFPRAELYPVPDDELLERFLAYNIDTVNAASLAERVSDYSGLRHKELIMYKNAYPDHSLSGIIRALLYGLAGKKPPGDWQPATLIDEIGGQAFIDKTLALHATIQRAYVKYLRKYNVHYIVTDRNVEWNPQVPKEAKMIYTDERFSIYTLQ